MPRQKNGRHTCHLMELSSQEEEDLTEEDLEAEDVVEVIGEVLTQVGIMTKMRKEPKKVKIIMQYRIQVGLEISIETWLYID